MFVENSRGFEGVDASKRSREGCNGRSLERLAQCLKTGADLIAILTDPIHTPGTIAQFTQDLDLPTRYQLWVYENLGGTEERVQAVTLAASQEMTCTPLSVVILQRIAEPPVPKELPLLGIPDRYFLSFSDRPGLMIKREVRVHILADLALRPNQVFGDIGARTGSVSIEVARLISGGQVLTIKL
ncbi:MAG: hypothetical protein AAGE59_37785 [Cyanobacteria bacterium P01_F01_bin.86]